MPLLGGLEYGWDLPGAQGLVHSSVVPVMLVCVFLLHMNRKLCLGKKSFKSWAFGSFRFPLCFGGSVVCRREQLPVAPSNVTILPQASGIRVLYPVGVKAPM